MAEFRTLVADTEKLLQSTTDVAGDQMEEIRGKIHDSLKHVHNTLHDTKDSLKDSVREHSQAAVDAIKVYVDEHPWQNIGIVASISFLLDLLISRH